MSDHRWVVLIMGIVIFLTFGVLEIFGEELAPILEWINTPGNITMLIRCYIAVVVSFFVLFHLKDSRDAKKEEKGKKDNVR